MSADSWQAAQNWLLFGAIAGGLAFYYYPHSKKSIPAPTPARVPASPAKPRAAPSKERTPRSQKAKTEAPTVRQKAAADKATSQAPKTQRSPPVQTSDATPDESEAKDEGDLKQWVQSMNAARLGTELKSADTKKSAVRTVKQNVARSSSAPLDENSDPSWSRVGGAVAQAGEVSDMLEPAAAGPSTLRITAPQQPVKEKAVRQPKKQEVETKKQRQNRQKKEAQRAEREIAEQERKVLEERQRRTAREARGEPARNGIPVPAAKAPPATVWTASSSSAATAQTPAAATPAYDGGALLDTFDGESTSSSYVGGSTAATSTTDAAAPPAAWADGDFPSGDAAYDEARAESELQSGWSEVKTKKGKKKTSHGDLSADGSVVTAVRPASSIPTAGVVYVNGTKPNGFQALDDAFDRHDSAGETDPSDAAAWEA